MERPDNRTGKVGAFGRLASTDTLAGRSVVISKDLIGVVQALIKVYRLIGRKCSSWEIERRAVICCCYYSGDHLKTKCRRSLAWESNARPIFASSYRSSFLIQWEIENLNEWWPEYFSLEAAELGKKIEEDI